MQPGRGLRRRVRRGFGKDEGQFTLPVSVAFDSEERLYVSDEYLNRVSIFNTDGELLGTWGVAGSGDGELNGPSGIAFDSDDNLYVAEQNNHRVQKFSRAGEFLGGWGSFGDGPGEFNMPWGVALDSDGNVYVGDWRNDRVQKFSPDGCHLASFGEPGEGEGQLRRPAGVAVDGNGNVYVADWGNERVQVFAPDGSLAALLRGEGTLSKWATEFLAANPDEMVVREKSNLFPDLPHPSQLPVPGVLADRAVLLGPRFRNAGRAGPPLRHRDEPAPLPGLRRSLRR